MPIGNGVQELYASLGTKLPAAGSGIRLGVDIYDELFNAHRIAPAQYNPVGLPAVVFSIPTLDKGWPVELDPRLPVDGYSYK